MSVLNTEENQLTIIYSYSIIQIKTVDLVLNARVVAGWFWVSLKKVWTIWELGWRGHMQWCSGLMPRKVWGLYGVPMLNLGWQDCKIAGLHFNCWIPLCPLDFINILKEGGYREKGIYGRRSWISLANLVKEVEFPSKEKKNDNTKQGFKDNSKLLNWRDSREKQNEK